VFYNHSSIDASEELFKTVFDELGVQRNAHSYVEALERCTLSKRGRERIVALAFAEDLWCRWQSSENRAKSGPEGGDDVPPRMVERAHTAFIRMLALYVYFFIFLVWWLKTYMPGRMNLSELSDR
jgi:hypothetical protein